MNNKLCPPPELIQKWCKASRGDHLEIILKAAEWGYQQHEKELLDAMHAVVPQPYEPEISDEENERRLKACLQEIRSLTHEDLVRLMGKEWIENYRRQFS